MKDSVKEERERLLALINSITDEVWFCDLEGNFTLENEAALKEFGINSPGIINVQEMARGLEVCYPDGRPRPIEHAPALRALKGEIVKNAEETVRTPATGELRYRQVNASPVRSASGNIVGSVSVVHDITDRKRAEERIDELLRERELQLDETQANFRHLVNTMADGVVVVDSNGYIEFANPAATVIFDLPEKELIGYPLGLPASRGIAEIETQIGKQTKTLEINSVRINWDDRPAYLVTLRDITQQKRDRERIRTLSFRLVEAQEKERRQIGHELHDEVGGALTGIKLLLTKSIKSLGEKAQSELKDVNDLLDETMDLVSTLSHNMRPDILDEFGLAEALRWYFEIYTRQTGIEVRFRQVKLDERYPSAIETTAYRIIQEALTNVARYAGVKTATVTVRGDSGKLYIQVHDRGCGFDPGQIDFTSSGISGMQDRALVVGGKLVVDSSPGRGTCVTCELPLDRT
jgi:PAS domain S-box-containing protein